MPLAVTDYICLNKKKFTVNDYYIKTVSEEDIYAIKDWRNAQIDVLRQNKLLTSEDQKKYFNTIIWPSLTQEHPTQILVSLFYKNELIGYGGLVHISWSDKRGELSFLTNPNRHQPEQYSEDFSAFIALMKDLVFNDLDFNRIHGETYAFRKFHISIMEKCGFRLEGIMRNHVFINNQFVDSLIHGINKSILDKPTHNVLLTSASRKVPMIHAIKSSLNKLGLHNKLYAADANPLCLAKHFTDNFWHMPQLNCLSLDIVLQYCKENNITAIIPSRDLELLFFANNSDELGRNGITVMVSSAKTVELCLDKLLFYEQLAAKKFPVIPTYKAPNKIQYNTWVVKEQFGAGSNSLALDISFDDAVSFSQKLKSPIYQPYIKGKEYSVDAYITNSGLLKGIVCRSRDLVVNGESQITTTLQHSKIENLVKELVKAFPFYGHVIFQILENDKGELHIIECNPRFGGASTISIAAGLDSFYWFLLESQGTDISNGYIAEKSAKQYKQIRYSADLIIEC